jgi:hypothetical protein
MGTVITYGIDDGVVEWCARDFALRAKRQPPDR